MVRLKPLNPLTVSGVKERTDKNGTHWTKKSDLVLLLLLLFLLRTTRNLFYKERSKIMYSPHF